MVTWHLIVKANKCLITKWQWHTKTHESLNSANTCTSLNTILTTYSHPKLNIYPNLFLSFFLHLWHFIPSKVFGIINHSQSHNSSIHTYWYWDAFRWCCQPLIEWVIKILDPSFEAHTRCKGNSLQQWCSMKFCSIMHTIIPCCPDTPDYQCTYNPLHLLFLFWPSALCALPIVCFWRAWQCCW